MVGTDRDKLPAVQGARRIGPRRRLVAGLVLVALVSLGCSGDDDTAPTTTTIPAESGEVTTTICPPTTTPPPAPPAGSDPYAVLGARQPPGPEMTTTTTPAAPVSQVIARPPDPDFTAAARQPDGQPLDLSGQAAAGAARFNGSAGCAGGPDTSGGPQL
jgi:hypothetical protein